MVIVRLNKFLSESGMCSRREADEHILAGDVLVNGEIAKPGQMIDSGADKVAFRGKTVGNNRELVYYAFYKPKSVVSTSRDELGRKTVLDFAPKQPRVFSVGRLDVDSEGLIILTNDGELTQKLTHPSFEHEKEYQVKVYIKHHVSGIKEEIAKKIITSFSKGIVIDGHLMRADSIKVRMIPSTNCLMLTIVLHTGYNRQIRKMCAKVGLSVVRLIRTRIGKLSLSELKISSGEYSKVSKDQIV